jgi:hypothetical protein
MRDSLRAGPRSRYQGRLVVVITKDGKVYKNLPGGEIES